MSLLCSRLTTGWTKSIHKLTRRFRHSKRGASQPLAQPQPARASPCLPTTIQLLYRNSENNPKVTRCTNLSLASSHHPRLHHPPQHLRFLPSALLRSLLSFALLSLFYIRSSPAIPSASFVSYTPPLIALAHSTHHHHQGLHQRFRPSANFPLIRSVIQYPHNRSLQHAMLVARQSHR